MTTPGTPNWDKVNRGLDVLQSALPERICKILQDRFKNDWWKQGVYYALPTEKTTGLLKDGDQQDFSDSFDLSAMLMVIDKNWHEAFAGRFDAQTRNQVHTVRTVRNSYAHRKGSDLEAHDAIYNLVAIERLLESLESPRAKELEPIIKSVTQLPPPVPKLPEKPVTPEKQAGQVKLPTGAIRPWREVIAPHRDVQAGTMMQSEFVANLAAVLAGQAETGYQDAPGFFERTYLTAGLRDVLKTAICRLGGKGGEPVVQLKTAFGGGKTHTMLALYHIARAGSAAAELPDMRELFKEAGVDPENLAGAQVAVLVGTALDATKSHTDATGYGIEVRTLWGEIGAQLGGQQGYDMVASADKAGTSPGSDTLVKLLDQFGPALILIDELVAYARNIYGRDDLPSGTFDNVLTFVHALTEAAKQSKRCLLVASVPESEIEVGGGAGREAQRRLEHTFGRLETVWRPISSDEGFEIVRRRLFSSVGDADAKEAVCKEFTKLYSNAQQGDFPPDTKSPTYAEQIRRCYPIHPEVFYQLYTHWSTLDKFQRTRGVLRLMATAIHELWEKNHQSLMIMPADLPFYHHGLHDEVVRYLEPTWNAVIERDVDGDESTPAELDRTNTRLGQSQATRKVARTVFFASAPHDPKHGLRGADQARIRLGVVEPGRKPTIHESNEALYELAKRASYLYSGDNQYWYDTHPNLNRYAEERAAQFSEYTVRQEIEKLLKGQVGHLGLGDNPFGGVHVFAEHGDIPDDGVVRLVILPPEAAYSAKSKAEVERAALSILEQHGSGPRYAKNMLVFLTADGEGLAALQNAVRSALAWQDIINRREELNLDAYGNRTAAQSKERADDTVKLRLQEAYCYLLVPRLETGKQSWTIDARRVGGQVPIVQRMATALIQDEAIVPLLSPKVLQLDLDKYFWKEGVNHVELKKLWETFLNYGYMPRLKNQTVLASAVSEGVRTKDYFGYASSVGDNGRYEGLIFDDPGSAQVIVDSFSVLVRSEVAQRQIDEDISKIVDVDEHEEEDDTEDEHDNGGGDGRHLRRQPTRFHGYITVDPVRPIAEVDKIANELLQHLTKLPGAKITLTVDIDATIPDGVPDDIVRTVAENASVLKFESARFEED